MAEVLDALPASSPRTRYPWEDWTDGRPRRLLPGRDFYTTVRGMRSTVQTRAKALDMAVAMVSERDPRRPAGPERSLCIQFFPQRAYRDGPPSPE
jgi:hypothetical protein